MKIAGCCGDVSFCLKLLTGNWAGKKQRELSIQNLYQQAKIGWIQNWLSGCYFRAGCSLKLTSCNCSQNWCMVCFSRNKSAGDFGFHGRWALLISDSRKKIISLSTLRGIVTVFAVIPCVVNTTCKPSRGNWFCLPPTFGAHNRSQSCCNLWSSHRKFGSFRQCFCIL